MKKALSITDICRKEYRTFSFEGAWRAAFAEPETTGTWFIWGNSGNGKSSFALQLCGELCKYGKVLYDSLEEGYCLTFRNKLDLVKCNAKNLNIVCEDMAALSDRLKKRRSPNMVIIDSFQYCDMNYKQYLDFKRQHANKLIVFISHADGRRPSGRSAKSVMFDASLKIWVEGYKAYSKGRFIGENGGVFTIWQEGADKLAVNPQNNK